MADATPPADPAPQGFPFITAGTTLVVLFAFLGLMWLAAQKENPLAEPPAADAKTEPKVDGAAKLDEVRARNQAALNGVGAKMPLAEAHGKLVGSLKGPTGRLPFPTPEPAVVAAPAPEKDEKKDEGKKP